MVKFSKDSPDPAAVVRMAAYPLTDDHDVQRILAEIGDASLVLLGEATHGTHDFYALRARISRALIGGA
jgi:erythromycin esterase-like protein